MSSLDDSASIFRYHRDMMVLHGKQNSFALGWKDNHSQLVRFEVLSKLADLTNRSVLDAGCGYGDLYPYLDKLYLGISYAGVEQIPELLNEAIANYSNMSNVSFIEGNFMFKNLPVTDYVLASGSLNYRSNDEQFIYKAITRLFDSCTMGLGFNLLSSIAPYGLLVAYDPEAILSFCNTLTTNVEIRTDYADEDFTIFMYH